MKPISQVPKIPIYLKTTDDMPRPTDAEFYWLTRGGMFLCRNHMFFASDTPVHQMPRSLADHRPACCVTLPLLGVAALEYVVGFFDAVYTRHGAEAIVLLLWDLQRRRYRLCVPPQEAGVWQSHGGLPCAIDVKYEVPKVLPAHHLLVGDIHSHTDMNPSNSQVDNRDALYRDGVHAIIGRLDRDPPEFHLELSVDSFRYGLRFGHLFQGYTRRRAKVPEKWLRQVRVHVSRPARMSAYEPTSYTTDTSYRRDDWHA
jgi:hypothetical protein